ncbi:MAG: hypothetical protein WEA29_04305 [Acidimicrobiia bacterium]
MRAVSPRAVAFAIALTLGVQACSDQPTVTTPARPSDTGDPLRPCTTTILQPAADPATAPSVMSLASGASAQVSASIAQATFRCARDVVVAPQADPVLAALGGRLAAHLGAPLLLVGDRGTGATEYEVDRLGPERLWEFGILGVTVPEFTETITVEGDVGAVADRVNREIGAGGDLVPLPSDPAGAARALAEAIGQDRGLDPRGEGDPTAEDVLSAGPAVSGWVWLVDHDDAAVHMAAMAAAANTDGLMATVEGFDLRANPEVGRLLGLSTGAITVHTVGVTEDARWQLPIIMSGQELPGGGYLLEDRRLVALYGNPLTSQLGILGRQSLEETIGLAREYAAPYGEDGVMVIPTFEIIATVAAANAGADGNYSNEMPIDLIRPWVETARREGFYVVLDLQSGRSHFLDQARLYEELLLEPHVGLALDPEWRLAPDQVHLRQIGRVGAAEVNEVSEWLAALVLEHDLPQKLFLVHQFRFTMLQNRELIEARPELWTVIQMDGQGLISDKYATWNTLTDGWEDHPWDWGWKNFTIEDSPGPIAPSEVLELVPTPVLVSYQ